MTKFFGVLVTLILLLAFFYPIISTTQADGTCDKILIIDAYTGNVYCPYPDPEGSCCGVICVGHEPCEATG